MKHWVWYLAGLLVAANIFGLPFVGTDVAKLQPVQVIAVSGLDGSVAVRTDTGDSGTGVTIADALADLMRRTPGYVFLETAQYLLITPAAAPLLEELSLYLRPGCSVYLLQDDLELTELAPYLSAHNSNVTLRDCKEAECQLPRLVKEGGRVCVASA